MNINDLLNGDLINFGFFVVIAGAYWTLGKEIGLRCLEVVDSLISAIMHREPAKEIKKKK